MIAPAKYAMVIDSAACFNCGACIISCQLENGVLPGHSRNWVKANSLETPLGMHFQPGNCMHCDDPTCVHACPTGATYKDPSDGVVKVRKDLCIGCGSCIPACPYGARHRHPQKKIVDKCDYCEARRQAGKIPACVETCPTQARTFGNLNDPHSQVAKLLNTRKIIRVVNQETDTDPILYYVDRTGPMDWTVKAEAPVPIQLWRYAAGPLVKGLVSMTGIGLLVMLGKQLLVQDDSMRPVDNEPLGIGRRRDIMNVTMFRRHTIDAMLMHWFNAICWIFLLASGVGLVDNPVLQPFCMWWVQAMHAIFGGGEALLEFHITVGAIWSTGILIYGAARFKHVTLPFFKEVLTFSPGANIEWLLKKLLSHTVGTRVMQRFGLKTVIPDQGFYNVGQKIFGITVLLGGIVIAVTGWIMTYSQQDLTGQGAVQWTILIHFLTGGIVLAGLMLHIYMAGIAKGQRPALLSMFTGKIPADYAALHYKRWFEEIQTATRTQDL
jgi:formate dehydrogenase gamma subunit